MRRRRFFGGSKKPFPSGYRVEEEASGVFKVIRHEQSLLTFHGIRADVEEFVARRADEERATATALATGTAPDVCALSWHRTKTSTGTVFFHYVNGAAGKMLIFRIGPAPFEHVCRTLWCHGEDARPWLCGACGEEIPEVLAS